MKNIHKKLIGLSFIVLFLFGGCTKDFETMNINPNEPTDVPTAYLFTSAEKVMVGFLWDEWWNGRLGMLFSQMWSQTSYTDESRYKMRDGVINNYWIYFYAGRDFAPPDGELNGGGMEDLQRIIELNTDPETAEKAAASGSNDNQIAAARILKVWMFQILTDIWGDIPYSEALKGAENVAPGYDKQQAIYAALLTEVTAARDLIKLNQEGIHGDIIYNGDMAKWKKFANSLKMRLGIRMSKVDPTGAGTAIQEALASGPFTSIDDNAVFAFIDGVPNNNPLNENQKIRSDFAVSQVLIDFLKDRNDPRTGFYANLPNDLTEYVGFPYGMQPADATPISNSVVSMPGNIIYAPTAPAFLMLYDEVEFIKAEAFNSLGVSGGNAEQAYYDGITASMDYWNYLASITPTGWFRIDNNNTNVLPEPITPTQMDEYMAGASVAWNQANAEKLIAEQKYIALYPQGLQAWFEYNRTSYPDVLILPGEEVVYHIEGVTDTVYTFISTAVGLTTVPLRLYYPPEEQDLNGSSYSAAVASQGPDNFQTHLWWQIPWN